MIKVYYCANCNRISFLSRELDTDCKTCDKPMLRLDITYSDFTVMNMQEREEVIKDNLEHERRRNIWRQQHHYL